MGSKGGGNNQATRAQSAIANQLFQQSDPLRRAMIGMNMGFLGIPGQEPTSAGVPGAGVPGGQASPVQQIQPTINPNSFTQVGPRQGSPIPGPSQAQTQEFQPIQPMSFNQIDVSALPQFNVGKDLIEQQFGRARENIIGSTPRGGAMGENLTSLETDRARGIGQLGADLTQQQLNQAFQLATGQTAAAQSGLNSVMNAQAQQAASQSAKKGAKGQAIGTVGAAALTKNPAAAATGLGLGG